MNKVYIGIIIVGIIGGIWICSAKIAYSKCKLQIAHQNQIQIQQSLEQKRVLNDKVYKTGVADIRRILQSKYTIAE